MVSSPETETEQLEESLGMSESQLLQVEDALNTCTDEEVRSSLLSLKCDLENLISLTKDSLLKAFQAEINGMQTNPEDVENISEAETLLSEGNEIMPGSKCQAPYNDGDNRSYHNALVMSVQSENEVKVMFVNPTCHSMSPCPFYLEGECKFSEEHCRYNHGHVVQVSELKEYREPDFSLVRDGAHVLAKNTDNNLWSRAVIMSTIPDDNKCKIKFEVGQKNEVTVDLHDVLPLMETFSENYYEDGLSNTLEDAYANEKMLISESLFNAPPSNGFGEWEKHTKSIGSKLMASMGYIPGTGLGKHGDGRIEPVSAVVLPPGRSLDHCMELRESAGNDPDLFKADRLHSKLQKKAEKLRAQEYERSKKNDVFSFMNDTFADKKAAFVTDSKTVDISVKESGQKALNIESFKVGENIRKKKNSISNLRLSLSRHVKGSVAYKAVDKKLNEAQTELSHLQRKEECINKELSFRDTKKKMTVF